MKYRIGEVVVISPPPNERHAEPWRGIRVRVLEVGGSEYRTQLLSAVEGWGTGGITYWSEDWLRPDKPLSALEELIVTYVEAQKAELGI
jgi:hypothetical protein